MLHNHCVLIGNGHFSWAFFRILCIVKNFRTCRSLRLEVYCNALPCVKTLELVLGTSLSINISLWYCAGMVSIERLLRCPRFISFGVASRLGASTSSAVCSHLCVEHERFFGIRCLDGFLFNIIIPY